MRVLIDPGHGGDNLGAVANWHADDGFGTPKELREKDITLAVAECLEPLAEPPADSWARVLPLSYWDLNVIFTRLDDQALSLTDRGSRAKDNDADLVIHLHCDTEPTGERNGTRCYYWPGSDAGALVSHTIAKHSPFPFGSNAPALPEHYPRVRNVLSKYPMTGVLVEMGFLSNERDRSWLQNAWVQRQLALAVLQGVLALGKTLEAKAVA